MLVGCRYYWRAAHGEPWRECGALAFHRWVWSFEPLPEGSAVCRVDGPLEAGGVVYERSDDDQGSRGDRGEDERE
jgi:hypothetical protein